MAASDAVATAAVSRREVRNSLERLEYHLSRGSKGRRGIDREVRLLDAIHRQAVRNAGAAIGASYSVDPTESFGRKALGALSGGSSNSATIGRVKSSILADYSADVLEPVRNETLRMDSWKWVANATACPTCLSKHGQEFQGQFVPTHPSCLCIAAPPDTPGLRTLSQEEIVRTHEQHGLGRYDKVIRDYKEGRIRRGQLYRTENVNDTRRGAQAVARHRAQEDVVQTGLPGGVAPEVPTPPPTPTSAPGPASAPDFDLYESIEKGWDDGTLVARWGAQKHKAIVQEASDRMLSSVTDPRLRRMLEKGFEKLDVFETVSKGNKSTSGFVRAWFQRGRTGHAGALTRQEMELNLRVHNYSAHNAYRKAVQEWNDTYDMGDLLDQRRLGTLTDDEFWAARQAAKDSYPDIKDFGGKYRDMTPDEVADVWLHEFTHVIDNVSGYELRKAAKDDLLPQMRAAYKDKSDEYAEMFWYGSETSSIGTGTGDGAEAVAEAVMFYFRGSGKFRGNSLANLPELSPEEWRARYPGMARFVEEKILPLADELDAFS